MSGLDKSRDDFESWYTPIFKGGCTANMPRRENGEYRSAQDQIAWMSYQEATRRAAQQPSGGDACSLCGGTGIVDDGEIDCYPNGEPYENGPVKCVKDCPHCSGELGAAGKDARNAELWRADAADLKAKLRDIVYAASAVVDRFDAPMWQAGTSSLEFINRLRAAIADASSNSPTSDGKAAGHDDANRFALAIALEDNAESLYAAVMSHKGDGAAIRAAFDADVIRTTVPTHTGSNRMALIGQHVTDFAAWHGWKPNENESAFEFIQRTMFAHTGTSGESNKGDD